MTTPKTELRTAGAVASQRWPSLQIDKWNMHDGFSLNYSYLKMIYLASNCRTLLRKVCGDSKTEKGRRHVGSSDVNLCNLHVIILCTTNLTFSKTRLFLMHHGIFFHLPPLCNCCVCFLMFQWCTHIFLASRMHALNHVGFIITMMIIIIIVVC